MSIIINRRLRIGLVFILFLILVSILYINYNEYESSTHPLKKFEGYETVAYVSFYTSALLKPNPFTRGQNVTLYIIHEKNVEIPIISCVVLKSNYSAILGASILRNTSIIPAYMAKEILLNINCLYRFNYSVIISDEGVYNTTICRGVSNNSYLILNVTKIANIVNELSSYFPGTYLILVKIVYKNSTAYFPINYDQDTFQILDPDYHIKILKYEKIPITFINVSETAYPLNLIDEYYVHFYSYPNISSKTNYTILVNTSLGTLVYKEGSTKGNFISLNVSKLYNYLNYLYQNYSIYSPSYTVIINFTIKAKNYTLYPSIVLSDNNGILTYSIYNNTITSPFCISSTTSYNPFNLTYLAIPLSMLFLILLFTRSKIPSEIEKTLSKLKKVRKLVIEVNKKPSVDRVVEVKSIDDIIKFAIAAAKPILVYRDKEVLQIWSIDDNTGYVYSINS